MTAAEKCEDEVRRAVGGLRGLVIPCSTLSLAGMCLLFNLRRGHHSEPNDTTLLSPARQCSFLLGQLLATPEPKTPREFGTEEWRTAEELLNRGFAAYLALFWPDPDSKERPPDEWFRVRKVAMPVFLHFFNTSVLASAEQVADRVRRYVAPFDSRIERVLGITASHALEIAEWIAAQLQETTDRLAEVLPEEKRLRLELLDRAEGNDWTMDDLRTAAQAPEYKDKLDRVIADLEKVGTVTLSELQAKFPDDAVSFWQAFSISRGAGPALDFPTERSVFDDRPLVRLADDVAIVPMANTLFSAILEVGERVLSTGGEREKYLRFRDRVLEDEVADHLKSLMGTGARILTNVFEAPDGSLEHDVVALSDTLCLVAEAKASPPREPFRDPEKAFPRLRDAFRADTGIRGAYEQGLRIWRRLQRGEEVRLFNGEGEEVDRIPASAAHRTVCVCVTRDSYGPLATDLALLLEKNASEPYPWVVNVLDLGALCEAWRYLKWDGAKLLEYLRVRIQLHGKAFSDDELDYAGYFIHHGGLETALNTLADRLFLNHNYSGVFDEIYYHLRYGTPSPDLKMKPPVMTDLRRSLALGRPVLVTGDPTERKARVGRNAPCPCGSGKKFKKCCGCPL